MVLYVQVIHCRWNLLVHVLEMHSSCDLLRRVVSCGLSFEKRRLSLALHWVRIRYQMPKTGTLGLHISQTAKEFEQRRHCVVNVELLRLVHASYCLDVLLVLAVHGADHSVKVPQDLHVKFAAYLCQLALCVCADGPLDKVKNNGWNLYSILCQLEMEHLLEVVEALKSFWLQNLLKLRL